VIGVGTAAEWWAETERLYGPMPEKGQQVRLIYRGGQTAEGVVAHVMIAMDTAAICLAPDVCEHGREGLRPKAAFPEFGDRWEPADTGSP